MSKHGIEHIIVLMLENRSFDHLFGFLDHPKPFDGLAGNEWNPTSETDPTKVYVTKGAKPYIYPDPSHEHTDVLKQMTYPGYPKHSNRGFYANFIEKGKKDKKSTPKSDPNDIMACWDPKDEHIKNITYLAKRYVLCDNWHCSVPGETWPNRNYIHAATSGAQVNIRLNFYTDKTIYKALADENITWNIYHDGIAQSMAFIKLQTLGKGGFRHFDKFAKDVKDNTLANYSFIEPRHFKLLSGFSKSMHPGNNSTDSSTDLKAADNLVGDVYNTLISNPALWQKTLLIITFDEHGGFYDHKKTRSAFNPGKEEEEKNGFKFNILGVRVPTILISPQFNEQTIDSKDYDHTSVIKSVFDNFNIPGHLTNRDKNAKTFWENLKTTTRGPSKKYESLQLHKLSKIKDTDTHEHLNGFQTDLVQLGEKIEQIHVENVRGSAVNLEDQMSAKKIKNKWNSRFKKTDNKIAKDRLVDLSNKAG